MRNGKGIPHPFRSLPPGEWPEADRVAWTEACRPGLRLRAGGAASGYAEASREDFARRYGAFLGFLQRSGRLELGAAAGSLVTPRNVEAYVAELQDRVSSVTSWNCVYKLRMTATLMCQTIDLAWLAEIEKDLALVAQPRSKLDRLVFSDRLAEAGLILIGETRAIDNEFNRSVTIRNGLMLTVLALCPMRLKNFAELELGTSFLNIDGCWWITIPKAETKTKRTPEERRLPPFVTPHVDLYVNNARKALLGPGADSNMLWISCTTGVALTKKNLGTLISKLTRQTIGVDVSPHLFRTAAATTAAAYAPHLPYLASAVLGHADERITEEHYNRANSVHASNVLADLVAEFAEATE
jgi:integrase